MTELLQKMLAQQEAMLSTVLDPARFVEGKLVVLNKLPLWGELVEDNKIDF